eukprot:CAMPEP_0175827002 /NCGR_PEP_ID=MMETSP0107_2-20121207/12054_1 /TAXON_ID=195067 ORGANISM="Goniomonas pacifica, Strain CCMP1869" /NCGR_SAMPLE_ID=MMETSP0107_2 /ASSEMBLY_ACC=CAM_ASM_000203 /LENGTH=295 /DNA_ID=CAMNT_0017139655 /DNA_START=8 /DNA_END=895 /DNA_ORIENTATION=-
MTLAASLLADHKAELKKRHAALMTSRATYKQEKDKLERMRGTAEYSACKGFLVQVKATLNQQAKTLNADAARIRQTDRALRKVKTGRRDGDVSPLTSLQLSAASASDCSTLESELAEAFVDLETSAAWRRHHASGPLRRIYYPKKPRQPRRRYREELYDPRVIYDDESTGDDSFYRRRRHAAGPYPRGYGWPPAMPQTVSVGNPYAPWNAGFRRAPYEDARLMALQRQLARWTDDREEARERMGRHAVWLQNFKEQLAAPVRTVSSAKPTDGNALQLDGNKEVVISISTRPPKSE